MVWTKIPAPSCFEQDAAAFERLPQLNWPTVTAPPDRCSQYTSEQFQKLMADHSIVCSMSRASNVWDNAAMESLFSSLKTERTARKTYRTRDEAKADVFDSIESFYNAKRRHSTIGYRSPMEFEMQAGISVGGCQPNRVQASFAVTEARCNT
jgi:transposase InsO family protein